jgi:putative hydrolase of the HAD superfamily
VNVRSTISCVKGGVPSFIFLFLSLSIFLLSFGSCFDTENDQATGKRWRQQANMFTNSPIRAIVFDAAGTLIHLPKGPAHHYAEVAARRGRHLDLTQLAHAFRCAWVSTPPPPASRTPRPDDDRSWWKSLVDKVLDECGVRRDEPFDRHAYFEELYAEFTLPGVWECYPEAISVLTELSRHFTLAVMSNFDGRLRPILRQLGLSDFFREVIISSEIGAEKPHPWIFEETSRRLALKPAEILHVGDDPEADWQGASQAGFQFFELRRPANSLRDISLQNNGPRLPSSATEESTRIS